MTMNTTITEQAVPAAERGFDPFASLPEPESESTPEAPDPIAAKLAELESWKAEQIAERDQQRATEQQASQTQAEQQFQAEQRELIELARQAAVGLDETERNKLFKAVEDASWGRVFNRPEAKQQLAAIVGQAQEYEQAKGTWSLIRETFGHNMSMARAMEMHERLMKVRDPEARKEVAQALANGQRQQNLADGVGNVRTEGPGNGGYAPSLSDQQAIAAYSSGQLPYTDPRVRRAMSALGL